MPILQAAQAIMQAGVQGIHLVPPVGHPLYQDIKDVMQSILNLQKIILFTLISLTIIPERYLLTA